ncbi:MAG: carboxypeptidase-like regulatory domain-containing protein, partial [Xanthomonadales bacterium]|nr:carboxypeptidase-like regulatory domain-containing protein [Xanthomonadales bacterium]
MNKKMFQRLMLVVCVGIGIAMLSQPTFADNSDGSIIGSVVDGSNSSVAGSNIVLINQANGYTRTVSSNENGNFRFARLPIGRYTVTVTKPGFSARRLEDVQVIIGGSTELSIVLSEGIMEEVIVTAAGRQEGVN